tara:strand:- start:1170 stop:2222 length:1053 start_codon:yes stop_codon:yes gene_type:complete
MKIMVTGNLGYVGPSVVKQLRKSYPEALIVGMDIGLFAHCYTGINIFPESDLDIQIYKDVREVEESDFEGFNAIVHLAAISNDPMGKTYERITDEINCQSSIKIANCAKNAGVKNYVFASSCSVYGTASEFAKKENDQLNPLTAYAKSKIDTEIALKDLASEEFTITCLRFATACGFSARTRLDLVLNDFVAGAISNGIINILSDGSPWRPLIHVSDMGRAIDWGVTREAKNGGSMLVVNAGSNEWNYQVKDLAEAVSNEIPETKVEINLEAMPDKRSYRVDFSKFKELAPNHQPKVSLIDAVKGLRDGLLSMDFCDINFRDSGFIRLNILNGHIESKRITDNLKWIKNS